MPNTHIEYFYRAGSDNAKAHVSVVLEGTLTAEQRATFYDHLVNGMGADKNCFDAEEIGLEDKRSEWGDAGPWHEFFDMSETVAPPTTDMSAVQLLNRLVAAGPHHQNLIDNPPEELAEEVDCTLIRYQYQTNMGRFVEIDAYVHGVITDAQEAEFKEHLVEIEGFKTGRKDCFDPAALGLPSAQDEDEGDMTPWHEVILVTGASGRPTVDMDIDDIVDRLAGNRPATAP